MTQEHDKFDDALRGAARDYNEPPELTARDLDAMWADIEVEAFPRRFASPSVERIAVRNERWHSVRSLLPLAAVLLIGVAIGRFGLPRKSAAPPDAAHQVAAADSVKVPAGYETTASKYLGQTTAVLASLPADARGSSDASYLGRAHDLLLTTRLLLDTPAASDPRFRTLLEDLELVLAQVVRMQSDANREDLELIRQALEQRDVLPRLRTAVADISADD